MNYHESLHYHTILLLYYMHTMATVNAYMLASYIVKLYSPSESVN